MLQGFVFIINRKDFDRLFLVAIGIIYSLLFH